jgi:hypothetical protein
MRLREEGASYRLPPTRRGRVRSDTWRRVNNGKHESKLVKSNMITRELTF